MPNRQGLGADVKRTIQMKKYEIRAWNNDKNEMMLVWQGKRNISCWTRISVQLQRQYREDLNTSRWKSHQTNWKCRIHQRQGRSGPFQPQ